MKIKNKFLCFITLLTIILSSCSFKNYYERQSNDSSNDPIINLKVSLPNTEIDTTTLLFGVTYELNIYSEKTLLFNYLNISFGNDSNVEYHPVRQYEINENFIEFSYYFVVINGSSNQLIQVSYKGKTISKNYAIIQNQSIFELLNAEKISVGKDKDSYIFNSYSNYISTCNELSIDLIDITEDEFINNDLLLIYYAASIEVLRVSYNTAFVKENTIFVQLEVFKKSDLLIGDISKYYAFWILSPKNISDSLQKSIYFNYWD